MRKLIKYWRANKRKILTVVGVLAFVIFIVHFINISIRNNMKEQQNNNVLNSNIDETKNPSKVIINDNKISTKTAQNNGNVIKEFVDYCNQKDYSNAYNILSEPCKKEVFNNDINLFIQNYGKKIFQTSKTYNVNLWATGEENYTYQILYYEDNLLATGGNSSDKNIEDYITIVKEKEGEKLNINSFIFYEEINKTIENNNVEITINNRKVYKTYEKYNFTVKNNSNSTISIANTIKSEDISLIDKNDTQYSSLIHEIPQSLLEVKSGYQSNIDLTFNKVYNIYRKTEKIRFRNIIFIDSEEENISIDINI